MKKQEFLATYKPEEALSSNFSNNSFLFHSVEPVLPPLAISGNDRWSDFDVRAAHEGVKWCEDWLNDADFQDAANEIEAERYHNRVTNKA